MRRKTQFFIGVTLSCALAACGGPAPTQEKAAAGADVTYFSGFRLLPGDGSPIQDDMVFIVENGKIKSLGKKGGDGKPVQGAARTDLGGQIIMPVLVNLNAHPGLTNGPTYGPENYNHDSVSNDLKRYLYYGVGSVLETGTDKDDISVKVRDEIKDGKTKGAALY